MLNSPLSLILLRNIKFRRARGVAATILVAACLLPRLGLVLAVSKRNLAILSLAVAPRVLELLADRSTGARPILVAGINLVEVRYLQSADLLLSILHLVLIQVNLIILMQITLVLLIIIIIIIFLRLIIIICLRHKVLGALLNKRVVLGLRYWRYRNLGIVGRQVLHSTV